MLDTKELHEIWKGSVGADAKRQSQEAYSPHIGVSLGSLPCHRQQPTPWLGISWFLFFSNPGKELMVSMENGQFLLSFQTARTESSRWGEAREGSSCPYSPSLPVHLFSLPKHLLCDIRLSIRIRRNVPSVLYPVSAIPKCQTALTTSSSTQFPASPSETSIMK